MIIFLFWNFLQSLDYCTNNKYDVDDDKLFSLHEKNFCSFYTSFIFDLFLRTGHYFFLIFYREFLMAML